MKKKRIYYKSDFIIQERHESGYNVPFRFFYYSASKSRYHLASFDGQNYEGCRMSEDGQTLIVPVDNKDLGVGILMVYRHYFLNNDMYEDNICDRFVPAQPVMDTSLGELSVVELTNEDEGTVDIYSVVMPYYAQGPQGEQGPQGPKGEDGYTPQRGVDYWTEDDETKLTEAKRIAQEALGMASDVGDVANYAKLTAEEAVRKGDSALEKNEELQGSLDRAMIGIECHDIMNYGQSVTLPEGYIIGSTITCRMSRAQICMEGESYVTIGYDPTQYPLYWNDNPAGLHETWHDGDVIQIRVDGNLMRADAKPWKLSEGPQGPQGEPGYTPQRGVDYWTAEDESKLAEAKQMAEQANAKAEEALDLAADNYWYGIEWDTTISNPKCKRIGNLSLHRDLPLQSMMRCCLLNDDGTVNYYLNPNNSILKEDGDYADLSGKDGMYMVELPDMWVRFEQEGTKRRAMLATRELPGFHIWRKGYISSVEATVQRSTNKLASVMSGDVDYRGGNNDASLDGTYKTMRERPATQITLNDFRTYARNRGSVGWNCYLYRLHKMLFWLYAVEYANFNSQDAFNAELDANGYHQGGLGNGVTTWNYEWYEFNDMYPVVVCGVTSPLGNHTGTVAWDVLGQGDETVHTFAVPRYRGVENPFGHIFKAMDGCRCIIQSDEAGGLSKFYVCDDPAKLSASGVGNYEYRGNIFRSEEGYISDIILGDDGEIIASEIGGSNTTYFCDIAVTMIPESGEIEGCVVLNNRPDNGVWDGLISQLIGFPCDITDECLGTRLCYDPQATTPNQ